MLWDVADVCCCVCGGGRAGGRVGVFVFVVSVGGVVCGGGGFGARATGVFWSQEKGFLSRELHAAGHRRCSRCGVGDWVGDCVRDLGRLCARLCDFVTL